MITIKYRSRIQIMVGMLEAARNGTNKTRIMYGADMSFKQLNEYLPVLMTRGLIEYDGKTKVYQTTGVGMEFLKNYEKLKL